MESQPGRIFIQSTANSALHYVYWNILDHTYEEKGSTSSQNYLDHPVWVSWLDYPALRLGDLQPGHPDRRGPTGLLWRVGC